jgi:Mg2+ and Co2+ transporter CorA
VPPARSPPADRRRAARAIGSVTVKVAPLPSPALLDREDGFVWVDIPECDEAALRTMATVLRFHPLAIRDCRERTHVPKVHVYPEHLFIILHAPEPEVDGHVHLLELDQFVGRRYLVTVHGPLGAGVPLEKALRETQAALQRMVAGRYSPRVPAELSYSIVSALARHMAGLVAALATKVAALERKVMDERTAEPSPLLEAMFNLRHELLTIRTVAAHSHEIYTRVTSLAGRFVPAEDRPFIDDLVDQFARIRSMCDGEQAFLQGVIDFFQTRTMTKLHIAMERLALLSALLLPVTAVASLYGMNIIVNQRTSLPHLAMVLFGISLVVLVMFRWARRQGWW